MNTAAFASIMVLIVFGFIAAMIWAYRKNDYVEEKPKVAQETLNSFDETLRTITTIQGQDATTTQETTAAQDEAAETPEAKSDIELQSRKQVIQNKNHIKKSAADEYFEKTKNVANEILQPKK